MIVSDDLKTQIDEYLDGTLDETGLRTLEAALTADPAARAYFIRYAQLHTDLHLDAKSSRAATKVLTGLAPARTQARGKIAWAAGMAAMVTVAVAAGWTLHRPTKADSEAVAWLVNAQNCTWTDGRTPDVLTPGTQLKIDRGLAEIRFRSGAHVILDGPARMELVSGNSATLFRGRATAHVPEPAIGFEVKSPQGTVIDLGTEFGITVGADGTTNVMVFDGKVEAFASRDNKLSLTANQSGTLSNGSAKRSDGLKTDYVRAIVPPPVIVAMIRTLDFRQPIPNSLTDREGRGTGFTHRLKWTGFALPAGDPNLNLNPDRGIELTTTNSDINGQYRLGTGEYLGLRLADLGFTGTEDFEIAADFPHIPALRRVGQFGVYVGTSSSRNVRGGLISKDGGAYTQNIVNNFRGRDTDSVFVGLSSTGDDLRVILKRTAGRYAMTVENRTRGSTVTLTTKQPTFLNAEPDLYVGVFGANTQSNESKTLAVREVRATVWKTEPAR